jgi:transposase
MRNPEAQIGARIRSLACEIQEEWTDLDRRVAALDREFVEHARADEAARRLVSIPGIGTMTATALRAAVDDGSTFTRARDLAAWLGLVPRQHTTGGKPKLLGISKRGNAYLRGLFIQGARAALASMAKAEDATGRWLRGLLARARAHYNAVVVALAAKLARIAWATLRKGVSFERQPKPAHA